VIVLNPSGAPPLVRPVAGFDCRVAARSWPFAETNAAVIAQYWEEAKAATPTLFNGRALVAQDLAIDGGMLRATYVEIRYSALLYWRSLGFPTSVGAFIAFGDGVVVSRDGAVLMAEMGRHTANAGGIFFPAGTPDPSDVRGDRLDLEGSILREFEEETGIGADLARPTEQRWALIDGPVVSCARRIDVDLDGEDLLAQVRGFLSSENEPELAEVILVRSMADIDRARVPAYAQALLRELVP
jgi:8-oxo-dGTP pyrophosphatase MutT (NUDIX family)